MLKKSAFCQPLHLFGKTEKCLTEPLSDLNLT